MAMENITRPGLPALSEHLPDLVSEVGTPFYSYHWETLRGSVELLLDSAKAAGLGSRAGFHLAFFALPNVPLIVRLLEWDSRLGVTCNTLEEVIAFREWGWGDWARVTFSGGVLPRAELVAVAETGCWVNAASEANLRHLLEGAATERLGIRLDFSRSALKGIWPDELAAHACLSNQERNQIRSLHAYPGTEVHDITVLTRHAERLLRHARQYPELQTVNLGGGFWYDYEHPTGDLEDMVPLRTYFSEVRRLLDRHLRERPVRLCWEPGRVAFAAAGFFVTRVVEVRKTRGNLLDLYVDGSFTQVPSPKLRNRQHRVVILGPDGQPRHGSEYDARICGATTLSTDQLIPGDTRVPLVHEGDYVVLLDVGAYGRAGSYNFLGKTRPPEVLQTGSSWELIRRRQRMDHLLEDLIVAAIV
jgi:diaminopimelate decarboxylase